MITKHRLLLALALSATLASGATQAAGLMDSLSSAAGELSKSGGDSSGGMSLSLADRPVERWRQGVELQQHDQCRRYPAVLCEKQRAVG